MYLSLISEKVISELLLALIKTVKSERFAALPKRALKDANANVTIKDRFRLVLVLFLKGNKRWII